ncbi:MAG TPA: nitrilase-related carbon-nitrogen hydrolase [Verrucomicrobiae bacterium]|nr:nitrilase-related carbon-nitrogen hydrolase [Verrucomicrobiae bacterium]
MNREIAVEKNDDPVAQPIAATGMRAALTWKQTALLMVVAVLAFQLAYTFSSCSFLIGIYIWCLFQLTRLETWRKALYLAFATGILCYAPQSAFLWTIFGPAAIALWSVLAFWLGLFVLLGNQARRRFGDVWGVLLIPFLWTGLEYFRSELYYLRFSWLNVGYAFAQNASGFPVRFTGMYGIGFVLVLVIAATSLPKRKQAITVNVALLALFAISLNVTNNRDHSADHPAPTKNGVQVAGVQLEFPSEQQVLWNLDKLAKQFPEAQLLLLSEYTLTEPVPEKVKNWCRKNHRYLVIGAEDPAPNSNYYDTAFVIGPDGEIVFRQGKRVPIQFFKDGLPAKKQELWKSPWGKIGFCICYDLSYTRVTDVLVRMGAQAIIVPTMDVADWGLHQHELHARVAPTRNAEYGLPIFRLASSGISQFVDGTGRLLATAPMPGEEASLSATLVPVSHGRLPWDRFVASFAVVITSLAICWFIFCSFTKSKEHPKPS